MDQTPEAENLINWAKYMNSFSLIEDYIFAKDFLRFLTGHFKKSHVKYVFSNTGHIRTHHFARNKIRGIRSWDWSELEQNKNLKDLSLKKLKLNSASKS